MNKKLIFLLVFDVFLLTLVVIAYIRSPKLGQQIKVSKPIIQESIDKVIFDIETEHIVADKEPESNMTWLINSGTRYGKNRYMFVVFSMDRVDMLNKKYNGYRNWATCNSAGANEGQNSISTVILITKEPAVKDKLKQVFKISLNSPVIKITGSKLKIVDYTDKGRKVYFATPMVYYLVRDIEIITDKYS
ncbi:MAG: hypothetical protein ABH865_07000 [Candidatus Omnitrophota bacterium]|nr:hypothetical protein [Candidatus Omnitrophota bacterium]